MLVSPERAIEASSEAYVQTLKPLSDKGKLDNNPPVSKRVKHITGRIISQAIIQYPHTRNWDWNVKVIDAPETINAWCMAGGRMAIYSGFIDKIKPTDDELAQVMGHEISHALANHTAEKMSVAMAAQLGLIAVAITTRESSNSRATLTGAALAAKLALQLPNSRIAEREADRMGIELAARAGYDPYAAASLWGKMARAGGKKQLEFLSTHPSSENRQKTLKKLAEKVMPLYKQQKEYPVYLLK